MKNVINLIERHYARLSIRKPFIELSADLKSFVQFIRDVPEVSHLLRTIQKVKAADHRQLQVSLRKLRLEVENVKKQLIALLDSIPLVKDQVSPLLLKAPHSLKVFGISEIKDPFFQADGIVCEIYGNIRPLLMQLLTIGQKHVVEGFAKVREFSDGYGFEISFPSTDETNRLLRILREKRQSELWEAWDTIQRFYEQVKGGISSSNPALISNLANLANHEKLYDCIDRFCLYLQQNIHRDQRHAEREFWRNQLSLSIENNFSQTVINNHHTSLNVVNTVINSRNEEKSGSNETQVAEGRDSLANAKSSESKHEDIQSKDVANKVNICACVGTGELPQRNNTEALSNVMLSKDREKIKDFYFNVIEFFYDSVSANLWIILHTPTDMQKFFMGHFKNGRADDLAQKLMQEAPKTTIRSKRLSHTCGELKLTKDLKRVFFSSTSNGKALNVWNGAVVHANSIQTGGKPFSPQKIIQQLHQIHSSHGAVVPEFPIQTYSRESRAYTS
jgi:hypothetical protein